MDNSTLWWMLSGALVALELITGTFFLLMLAIGSSAGALAAHLGLGLVGQLVSASLLGMLAVALWHWRQRRRSSGTPRAQRSVNLDIGEVIQVDGWDTNGLAEVNYRGATWQAITRHPYPTAGQYRVIELQGNRLVLEPVAQHVHH